jgi:hypothetical protein
MDRQRDFYLRARSSFAPYADFRADARRSLLHTRGGEKSRAALKSLNENPMANTELHNTSHKL